MTNDGWIGVDFDATLAIYDHWRGINYVGEPIKPMCDRVRGWLAEGKIVKIMTARVYNAGDQIGEILKPIDDFCLREFGQTLEVTCVKDMKMIELWDDRAVQIIPNTGMRADGKN